MENQIVGVFSVKGGVGKTSLSVALYNDLNAQAYYSNENNDIKGLDIRLLSFKNAIEKRQMSIAKKSIFDFGGFSDDICDFLRICNVILVPTTRDRLSLQKAFMTIKALEKINNNLILVMTRVLPKFNDVCDQAMDIINPSKKYRICYLNESKIFTDVIEQNKGILELGSQFAYQNKAIVVQWQKLLRMIKGEE